MRNRWEPVGLPGHQNFWSSGGEIWNPTGHRSLSLWLLVLEHDGLWAFCWVLFGLCAWRFLAWTEEETACPYTVLGLAASRTISWREVGFRIAAHLIAAAVSLEWGIRMFLFLLSYTQLHTEQWHSHAVAFQWDLVIRFPPMHRAMSYFWHLELHPKHVGKYLAESWYHCGTHINVSVAKRLVTACPSHFFFSFRRHQASLFLFLCRPTFWLQL